MSPSLRTSVCDAGDIRGTDATRSSSWPKSLLSAKTYGSVFYAKLLAGLRPLQRRTHMGLGLGPT